MSRPPANIAQILTAFVALVFFIATGVAAHFAATAPDFARACSTHSGVQQVAISTLSIATVVCRDGSVHEVRP